MKVYTDLQRVLHTELLKERQVSPMSAKRRPSKNSTTPRSFPNAHWQHLVFAAIFLIGLFARAWQFGTIPGDINQDEAFAGYEALSLLRHGTDSFGYRLPVYLTAWGSGMNVLNSLLMIPFMAIFGAKTWVLRLPQLLVALFTLPAVYGIGRRIRDEKLGLCMMFLTAVAPWHIMLARWGLESNLAPGFLIFGLFFFLKGLEKPRFLMLSALMYGLSLYCYATIWPFVPLMLALELAYSIYYKKLRIQKESIAAAAILFVLALPLLLFLLVNKGILEEIRTPFFSIPKLLYMRADELSLSNLGDNLQNLLQIIGSGQDGLPWNSIEGYGIFYPVSLIFAGIGLILSIWRLIQGFRKKEMAGETFLLINFVGGFLLGLLINVNINRVNSLWLPMIFLAAYAIYEICQRINPWTFLVPLVIYSVLFVQFEKTYFTQYASDIEGYFCKGLEQAVDAAMESAGDDGIIYCASGANYARVLFYSEQDSVEYRNTVQYTNYPSAFLDVSSFGRFRFSFDASSPQVLDPQGTYLLDSSYDSSVFEQAGYSLQFYDYFVVATPSQP